VATAYVIHNTGKDYSAIAASNDTVIVGIRARFAQQNVLVSEDMSVIGFDDCIYVGSAENIPYLKSA